MILTGRELAGIAGTLLRAQLPEMRKKASQDSILIIINDDVLVALGIPLNKKKALEKELLASMQNTRAAPDERYVHRVGKDIAILVKHVAAVGTVRNILVNFSTKFSKPEEVNVDTILNNQAYTAEGRAYQFLNTQGTGLSKSELLEALDVLPSKKVNIQLDNKTHSIDIKSSIQGFLTKAKGLDIQANIVFPMPAGIKLSPAADKAFIEQMSFKLSAAVDESIARTTIKDIDNLVTQMFLGKKVLKKRNFKSSGNFIYELKSIKATVNRTPFQMRNTHVRKGAHFASMQQLRTEVGLNISEEIRKIMRNSSAAASKRYLRTQTGTFADSVDIGLPRRAKTAKSNRITVPFSYKTEVYSTFEQGNAQGSKGRDPRLIIGKAIKEVFRKKVLEKFSVQVQHRR